MPTETKIRAEHIAPCGVNCAVCGAFQRAKKPCPGCNGQDAGKPKHCLKCKIYTCETRKAAGSCTGCTIFPCRPLKDMDGRYQKQYYVSLVENLRFINARGIDAFLRKEEARFTCQNCGALVCQHSPLCPGCSVPWRP